MAGNLRARLRGQTFIDMAYPKGRAEYEQELHVQKRGGGKRIKRIGRGWVLSQIIYLGAQIT